MSRCRRVAMMNPDVCTNVAWAAGLIDGEGSIGFYGGRIHLRVVMTDEEPIRKLAQVFPESTVTWQGPRGHRKAAVKWYCRRRALGAVLGAILPHLTVKRSAAIRALRQLEISPARGVCKGSARGSSALSVGQPP